MPGSPEKDVAMALELGFFVSRLGFTRFLVWSSFSISHWHSEEVSQQHSSR